MARRNLVSYSDEEEEIQASPPPSSKKKNLENSVASDIEEEPYEEEEANTSMEGFIDDRAVDELSEHSDSAEDGFTDHEAETRRGQKTPPSKGLKKPVYPVDPDDEGVDVASDYEADIVESPKKRIVRSKEVKVKEEESENEDLIKATPKRLFKIKKVVEPSDNDEDVDSDAMKVSPVQKKVAKMVEVVIEAPKRASKATKKQIEAHDDDGASDSNAMDISPKAKVAKKTPEVVDVDDLSSDKIQIVGHKKAPAKKKAPVKKSVTPAKGTPSKRTPKKKPLTPEILTDTDDDAIAALKLDKDDEMYPEKKSAKVQASNLKRGLPITPPLATRSASKRQKTEPAAANNGSPVKKPSFAKATGRDVEDELEEEEHQSPVSPKKPAARKAPLKPAKQITARATSDDDDDDKEEKPAKTTKKAAKVTTRKMKEVDDARATTDDEDNEEQPVKPQP